MNEFVEKIAILMFVTILVAFVGLAVFYMKRRIQNAETSIKDQAKVIQNILEMVGNLATRLEENQSGIELSIGERGSSQSRFTIEKESQKIVVSDDEDEDEVSASMTIESDMNIENDIKTDVEQVIHESKEKKNVVETEGQIQEKPGVVYVEEIDNEEIKEIKSAGHYENYKMTELRAMMDDRGLNSKGKLKKDIIDMLVNYDKQHMEVES
tara:strand:- start:400 stop:1032 length:633 start_codon:yes stop_codon:yes gene_type:complete